MTTRVRHRRTEIGKKPSVGTRGYDANNRWDNLKNKHWNTMGPLAKVGHAKGLKSEKSLTPPLDTTIKKSVLIPLSFLEGIGPSRAISFLRTGDRFPFKIYWGVANYPSVPQSLRKKGSNSND